MNLLIKDVVKNNTAISYDDGLACLNQILNFLEKNPDEKVVIDFLGIDYVITAFLNPIIGDLILKKGTEIMKQVEILNANQSTIEKIRMVKEGTLLKREDYEWE